MAFSRAILDQAVGLIGLAEGVIVGERQLLTARVTAAIGAASDAALAAAVNMPVLKASDALLIESWGGGFGCTDAGGFLTLLSSQSGLVGSLANSALLYWLPIFGQVGPLPKTALDSAFSFFVQPPPALRNKDWPTPGGAAVRQLSVVGVFRNADAAPHTAVVQIGIQVRVISGVPV